jgi:hypothetical protein
MDMNSYVIRSENGSTNESETLAKFQGELASFLAEESTQNGVISDVVDQVMEANKGTLIPVPYAVSQAVQLLNPLPTNYASLEKRVHSFITSQSRGENSALFVKKGAQGGICRRSDLPTDSK